MLNSLILEAQFVVYQAGNYKFAHVPSRKYLFPYFFSFVLLSIFKRTYTEVMKYLLNIVNALPEIQILFFKYHIVLS